MSSETLSDLQYRSRDSWVDLSARVASIEADRHPDGSPFDRLVLEDFSAILTVILPIGSFLPAPGAGAVRVCGNLVSTPTPHRYALMAARWTQADPQAMNLPGRHHRSSCIPPAAWNAVADIADCGATWPAPLQAFVSGIFYDPLLEPILLEARRCRSGRHHEPGSFLAQSAHNLEGVGHWVRSRFAANPDLAPVVQVAYLLRHLRRPWAYRAGQIPGGPVGSAAASPLVILLQGPLATLGQADPLVAQTLRSLLDLLDGRLPAPSADQRAILDRLQSADDPVSDPLEEDRVAYDAVDQALWEGPMEDDA